MNYSEKINQAYWFLALGIILAGGIIFIVDMCLIHIPMTFTLAVLGFIFTIQITKIKILSDDKRNFKNLQIAEYKEISKFFRHISEEVKSIEPFPENPKEEFWSAWKMLTERSKQISWKYEESGSLIFPEIKRRVKSLGVTVKIGALDSAVLDIYMKYKQEGYELSDEEAEKWINDLSDKKTNFYKAVDDLLKELIEKYLKES